MNEDSDDEFIGPQQYFGGDKSTNDSIRAARQECKKAKSDAEKEQVNAIIATIGEAESRNHNQVMVDFLKLKVTDDGNATKPVGKALVKQRKNGKWTMILTCCAF